MINKMLITAVVSVCLILSINSYLHAENKAKKTLSVQEHIKKVKVTSPQKYQEMLKGAGGNTTYCLGCHKDLLKPRGAPRTIYPKKQR